MKPPLQWISWLNSKQKEINGKLISRNEMGDVIKHFLQLADCPLKGLQYTFTLSSPFNSFVIGETDGANTYNHTFDLKDPREARCEVRYSQKDFVNLETQVVQDALAAFGKAWWKSELRTESAGLLDLKRSQEVSTQADTTIHQSERREHLPSVVICDLDNFKAVNTAKGQDGGDLVILQFGALLEEAVAPYGIPLHYGGDEFVILCPHGGAESAILACYAISKAVQKYDFKLGDLKMAVSAGITSSDPSDKTHTFQSMLKSADVALKLLKSNTSSKGSARFNELEIGPIAIFDNNQAEDLYKILVLSSIFRPNPFCSPWLNTLSRIVREMLDSLGDKTDAVSEIVSGFIQWMKPRPERGSIQMGFPPEFRPTTLDPNPVGTMFEFAASVCHGILTSNFGRSLNGNISIKYSTDWMRAAVYIPGSALFWQSDDSSETYDKEIVLPVTTTDLSLDQPINTSCRAILIKIGHSPLPVPANLFCDIIVVDDRPTRGGCLPDFWEATIGRLALSLYQNPNVTCAFVVGNPAHAKETVSQLQNIDKWHEDAEAMAARTAVTSPMLLETVQRLVNKLYFLESYEPLLNQLSNEFADLLQLKIRPDDRPTKRPLLNRLLDSGKMALLPIDGCRVDTVADAFPVVLEIARRAEGTDTPLIKDQAGQILRELVDFKVVLRYPEQHTIPDYYDTQAGKMDEYFKKAFLDETEYFGKALHHGNQLGGVISHVVNIIKEGDRAFATRRAILVVPHELTEGGEIAPLGLVSIRIIPRFFARKCVLSYSFTWRTVEALVGFPYSIYGSVRYAQHLTNLITSEIPSDISRKIVIGTISYVAHSLHIFVDDYGQRIVRRIVNDATA